MNDNNNTCKSIAIDHESYPTDFSEFVSILLSAAVWFAAVQYQPHFFIQPCSLQSACCCILRKRTVTMNRQGDKANDNKVALLLLMMKFGGLAKAGAEHVHHRGWMRWLDQVWVNLNVLIGCMDSTRGNTSWTATMIQQILLLIDGVFFVRDHDFMEQEQQTSWTVDFVLHVNIHACHFPAPRWCPQHTASFDLCAARTTTSEEIYVKQSNKVRNASQPKFVFCFKSYKLSIV